MVVRLAELVQDLSGFNDKFNLWAILPPILELRMLKFTYTMFDFNLKNDLHFAHLPPTPPPPRYTKDEVPCNLLKYDSRKPAMSIFWALILERCSKAYYAFRILHWKKIIQTFH